MDKFLAELLKRGRSHLDASTQVPGLEGPALEYNGTVHARLVRE
ncbi:MAG: hypothetical protein ABW080_08860 [Candidatus Thiodiazotropha sp.]